MLRMILAVLLLAVTLVGCRTGQAVTVDDSTLTPAECGSAQVQRLITYCASPQAADLAARNAELMGKPKAAGDIPYSPVPIGDSPVLGPDSAAVTVVMFTDLECPYCQRVHESLMELQKESPEDIRIVFKHTPLSFHEFAIPAALGALAAREQGKFWEYADLVYSQQDSLDASAFLAHAATLDLDLEQFRNDFGSAKHVAAVEADLALASQVGVRGTPTMFVNGVRVIGVYPVEELRALIANQKELVQRLEVAGVPKDDLYWRLVSVQYQQVPESDIDERPEEPEQIVAHVPVLDTPVRGAAADDALVTIVEFSDFQCPFCAGATTAIEPLIAEAKDVRMSFRHFPLGNHPDAGPAAVASLVAYEAGKFWEFHDLLFANQADLSLEALKAHAEAVGVDPAKVEAAMENAELQGRVISDQKLGIGLGVRGTPTFLVNGIMVMGMASVEEFAALIDAQRQLASAIKAETGLTGEELYKAVVNRNLQAAQAE